MQTSSSAYRTCSASRSASECTATVFSPISLQARMTRRAISPRLAMRTLEIMELPVAGARWPERSGYRQPGTGNCQRASHPHRKQLFTVLDRLSILRKDPDDLAIGVAFDFVHQFHRFD